MNDVSSDKGPNWAEYAFAIGSAYPVTVPSVLSLVLGAILALALWGFGVSGVVILPWCLFAAALVFGRWMSDLRQDALREQAAYHQSWADAIVERNALQQRYEGDSISPYRAGRARVVRFNEKAGKICLDPEVDAFLPLRPPPGQHGGPGAIR